MSVSDLYRKHGITDAIFYMCHSNYCGLEVSDCRELNGLEKESAKLKTLHAAYDRGLDD